MAVLTKVVICASLEYVFVSLDNHRTCSRYRETVIRYADVDLAWPAD